MNYEKQVLPILKEAGDALTQYFGKAEVVDQKTADALDVVTELDRKTEQYIAEKLRDLDSSIGFLGEEFGGDENQERFWLCDPIDGTLHFVRGLPFCTNMLALIEGGEVVFSAIYDFLREDMYWAERGKGAFRNKESIRVSTRDLRQSLLSLEMDAEKEEQTGKAAVLASGGCVLFHTVNCGFEYPMVASGKLEGRIVVEPHGKIWDYAPGSLLVAEAGGIVVNIGETTYDYRNLRSFMGNPRIYKELTEGENAPFPIL